MPPAKKTMLEARLQKRLKAIGIPSFEKYGDYVFSPEGRASELVHLIDVVTTNKTDFFREPAHFEFLVKTAIPSILHGRGDLTREPLRIWSAGCSTGEEPYTIAICLLEKLQSLAPSGYNRSDPCRGWDIKILASDLSTKVLNTAQEGIYSAESLCEDLPEPLLKRYFEQRSDDRYVVKDAVKQLIRFRRLNFKDRTYPFKKSFDLIFCRNVMIYFDEAMKNHVLTRFHQHLVPHGNLFLGHSETMFGSTLFSPVHITVYRKQ